MSRQNGVVWAVVHYRRRGPSFADGPYYTRADAEDVRRKQLDLSDEENVEAIAAGWRMRVVPMYGLLTTDEFAELMASAGPASKESP